MPIEKGDFILVKYVGRVKETGEAFDTTFEEVARDEKLYKDGEIYEPKLVVPGEGWLLKALDERLLSFEVGKTSKVEISPDEAFGSRDPEKVKMVSLRRLTARGINPQLGMRLEVNGKLATVRTMGSGRVQLDFNPPLAGKTLIYELTVERKLKTKKEKISALIHRRIPAIEIEKFELKTRKATAIIVVPEEAFYFEGLQLAKRGIAMDVQRFFPEITTVQFIESFQKKEAGGA